MLDVLAHIQTHLEDDLSLAVLAGIAQMSPFHFQRRFKEVVGESPRKHVERSRLERAAAQLLMRDAPILDIAVEHGFQSHEVFTRAFRRHFQCSPTDWRSAWASERRARGQHIEQSMQIGALSVTRFHELRPMYVAFVRHVGPYEDVPLTNWRDLVNWAELRNIPQGPLFGIAHDAPGIVDAARLRFDAAMLVPAGTRARGKVGVVEMAGGPHAVTTYLGPTSGLADAYREIATRVRAKRGVELLGLPALERYSATQILGGTLESIEIALPVR